jgi:redox-sensitive bicupin YhaK (pirin superfamily)
VKIHQNVELLIGRLERGEKAAHQLAPSRHAWLQVARGAVSMNGNALKAGDGAAVSGEAQVEIRADEASELLLFDLA